jgi:long-subunit fatty acid transport protein
VGEEGIELERDGRAANDVSLKLPLPLTARFGVRYIQAQGDQELFDVEFDVVYETWSRVDQFTMDGDGLTGTAQGETLDVGRIEIDKQWKDTVGLHLGSDVAAIPDLLTVRGGLFYESAVADPSHAHVDFVSGQQLGGAVGTSLYFGPAEVAVAYEYRQQPRVSVSNGDARVFQEVPGSDCEAPYTDAANCHPEYIGARSAPVNGGNYRAHSHVVALDVMYRFCGAGGISARFQLGMSFRGAGQLAAWGVRRRRASLGEPSVGDGPPALVNHALASRCAGHAVLRRAGVEDNVELQRLPCPAVE